MRYGVLLGSNLLMGTSGVMSVVEDDGRKKEFFRIREIHRMRSEGAYIVVDCDIRDAQGKREIKLAKSRQVASDPEVSVHCTKEVTAVYRKDGTLIIKIEMLSPDDKSIPSLGPPKLRSQVEQELRGTDALLRITGSFYAGARHLEIDTAELKIAGIVLARNVLTGTGGITIGPNGISF